MLSYHFSKNLTKPIRQHFPGDIPGKLPKPPQSWPHAYGAQVVLIYGVFFHGQNNRLFPGTRTDGERIERTSGQPCLLRCERQRLQSRYDLPDRGHHLAGEEHPAIFSLQKNYNLNTVTFFTPERHTTFFTFSDNIVLLFWRTTCTVEPMCTTVWSLPIVEPTKSPTTDRSKPEQPGR